MHAGILDGRNAHSREITYEQAAFRTVRALSDIYMHSGDWSLVDAMKFCVGNAPHGKLPVSMMKLIRCGNGKGQRTIY